MTKKTKMTKVYLEEGFTPLAQEVWELLKTKAEVTVNNHLLGYTLYFKQAQADKLRKEVIILGEGIIPELTREIDITQGYASFEQDYCTIFNSNKERYLNKLKDVEQIAQLPAFVALYNGLVNKGYTLEPVIPHLGYWEPILRYKVFAKTYKFIGYLDYGTFINHYSGQHYFGLRENGHSVEEGMETTNFFRDFNEIANTAAELEGFCLLELSNCGKYNDTRVFDIWALVNKAEKESREREDVAYFTAGFEKGAFILCLVWNAEKRWETEAEMGVDVMEFSRRFSKAKEDAKLIKIAKEYHQKATRIVADPFKKELLAEMKILDTFDMLRQMVHALFEDEEKH